jgi:hypothetical protein
MSQPTPVAPPPAEVAAGILALGGKPLVRLAATHRARQVALAALVRRQLARLWAAIDRRNPIASWAGIQARAVALLTAAQGEAARGADSYVAAALAMQGATPDPVGLVSARAFAGHAADGRGLSGLLGYPAFEAQAFVEQGMDADQALLIGARHLDRIVATEVSDAARVATGVAVVGDRAARGYVRMLTPPSCSRCVVLAGRWYAVNAGFLRHPQCDCVHIPAAEDIRDEVRTDPTQYFDSLTEAQQDAAFTKAGAQAIRDGADIAQVVNARRGAAGIGYAAGRLTEAEKSMLRGGRQRGHLERTSVFGRDLFVTTEGTTTRGAAGVRLGARETGRKANGSRYRVARASRLMPESIYEITGGDRDEAIRLLKRNGYIV